MSQALRKQRWHSALLIQRSASRYPARALQSRCGRTQPAPKPKSRAPTSSELPSFGAAALPASRGKRDSTDERQEPALINLTCTRTGARPDPPLRTRRALELATVITALPASFCDTDFHQANFCAGEFLSDLAANLISDMFR